MYGWTPNEIGGMTLTQLQMYANPKGKQAITHTFKSLAEAKQAIAKKKGQLDK